MPSSSAASSYDDLIFLHVTLRVCCRNRTETLSSELYLRARSHSHSCALNFEMDSNDEKNYNNNEGVEVDDKEED